MKGTGLLFACFQSIHLFLQLLPQSSKHKGVYWWMHACQKLTRCPAWICLWISISSWGCSCFITPAMAIAFRICPPLTKVVVEPPTVLELDVAFISSRESVCCGLQGCWGWGWGGVGRGDLGGCLGGDRGFFRRLWEAVWEAAANFRHPPPISAIWPPISAIVCGHFFLHKSHREQDVSS